jgi:hypothetical protein
MKKNLVILSSLCFAIFSNSYCANCLSDAIKEVNDSNLLKNWNFSDSLKNWQTIGQGTNPYHPEDPGRADFKIENGVLEVKIKNSGNGIYSIMLYQKISLYKDSSYVISFFAKSDFNLSIISNLTQDTTYDNFSGDQSFKLSNFRTKYSYKFKMTQHTCPVLFQFCLGGKGTGSIFLDSISLKKQSNELTSIEIQSQPKSELKIFPNPAGERIILIADDQIINKVEILNMSGQLVATKVTGSQQVLFERNNIRSGTYFCKAFTKNSCLVGKLFLK